MESNTTLDSDVDWLLVKKKIKQLSQYSGNVSINFEKVNVNQLRPLCLFVRTYRLQSVQKLISLYENFPLRLFESAWIEKEGSVKGILVPPIIEVHNDEFVIIDGLHRLFEVFRTKRPNIYTVVIRGNLDKLPADILTWSEVQMTDRTMTRSEKFRNLDEANFRQINQYIDDFR